MHSSFIFKPKVRKAAKWALIIGILMTLGAQILAHAAKTNWFQVQVSNVTFYDKNGLQVRGKLFQPPNATADNPAPGVVYLHGYQNNRETSIPTALSSLAAALL